MTAIGPRFPAWSPGSPRSAQAGSPTRMKPRREEAVRIILQGLTVGDTRVSHERLRLLLAPRVEEIGTASDEFSPDEDLWNGAYTGALGERRPDGAAPIALLICN